MDYVIFSNTSTDPEVEFYKRTGSTFTEKPAPEPTLGAHVLALSQTTGHTHIALPEPQATEFEQSQEAAT